MNFFIDVMEFITYVCSLVITKVGIIPKGIFYTNNFNNRMFYYVQTK